MSGNAKQKEFLTEAFQSASIMVDTAIPYAGGFSPEGDQLFKWLFGEETIGLVRRRVDGKCLVCL